MEPEELKSDSLCDDIFNNTKLKGKELKTSGTMTAEWIPRCVEIQVDIKVFIYNRYNNDVDTNVDK